MPHTQEKAKIEHVLLRLQRFVLKTTDGKHNVEVNGEYMCPICDLQRVKEFLDKAVIPVPVEDQPVEKLTFYGFIKKFF